MPTAGSELAEEPERAALIQAAGEMALTAGRAEEAIRLLDAAAEAHARAGRERERALTAYPIGRALMRLGRLEEAATRITSALGALQAERFDRDVGRLNAILGRVLVWAGDYEAAGPALEAALAIAEARELPDVLGEALIAKGVMYQYTGRPQEAEALFAAAVRVAESADLGDVLARAWSNLGNLAMLWDRPGAREQTEESAAVYRRRGDAFAESTSVGNLMSLHLYGGRWEELERVAVELLDEDGNRPGAEFFHYRLGMLRSLRGEDAAIIAALDRLNAWRDSGDTEFHAMYDIAVMATSLSEGRAEQALEHALQTLGPIIDTLGVASDAVRDGWPFALRAALACGRHGDTHQIIGLLDDRPPGHVPPYLRTHLARGRALLNAAEDYNDTVETDLQAAIDAFAKLAYPYWHAATQTDLAAWLIDQDRGGEAISHLEQAIATLRPLRAAPALVRAETLIRESVSPTHVA